MSEKLPRVETEPEMHPSEIFEGLVEKGEWSSEIEERLLALLDSHETEMYMLYMASKEPGVWDDLPENKRRIFEWLINEFEKDSE